MRRFISLFFLFLFLLYHAGYISVYWLATHQIDAYWNKTENYDGPLKKISVEAYLPYWADQEEFSPTSGSFTMEGKNYRAVYQKYSDGSIHFLVVEDALTTHLNNSVKDWIKNATEPASEQPSKANHLKTVTKDYQKTDEINLGLGMAFTYRKDSETIYSYSVVSFIPEVNSPPPQI